MQEANEPNFKKAGEILKDKDHYFWKFFLK